MITTLPHPTTMLVGDPTMMRDAFARMTEKLLRKEHVVLVDSANEANVHLLARMLAAQGVAPLEHLPYLHLSRSFTMYQLVATLQKNAPAELRRWRSAFFVCLGPLETFYDESVNMREALQWLWQSIAALRQLQQCVETFLVQLQWHDLAGPRKTFLPLLQASLPMLRIKTSNVYGQNTTIDPHAAPTGAQLMERISPRIA